MNTILVCGASVRAAALSAKRGGLSVIAADLFADRDLRAIATATRVSDYPGEFARIRAQYPELPVVYTGALENHPALLDSFAAGGELLGNSADVVRRIRDPNELHSALLRAGISSPPISRTLPKDGEHRWLVKPISSAGGSRVRFLRKGIGYPSDCYFQEFRSGSACGGSFVAVEGKCQLIGVTDSFVGLDWAGATGFTYCGSVVRSLDVEASREWQKIGDALVREFRLQGLFGVDAIESDGAIWPIEVNPRWTASMELFDQQHDCSLMRFHVNAIREAILPATPRASGSHVFGKVILFARQTVQTPTDFEFDDESPMLADLPDPGVIVQQGHPIMTIITEASSADGVTSKLQRLAKRIYDQLIPIEAIGPTR